MPTPHCAVAAILEAAPNYAPPLLLRSEWTEEGQLWVQYVSSTPATRLDVINLQEQLDHRLLQRQARETGIDPVREELYGQCFGEQHTHVALSVALQRLAACVWCAPLSAAWGAPRHAGTLMTSPFPHMCALAAVRR